MRKTWYDYVIGVCLFILLGIIPFFISAKYIMITDSERIIRSGVSAENLIQSGRLAANASMGQYALDVFSYFKSLMICFVTLFMAIVQYFGTPVNKGGWKYELKHPVLCLGAAFIFCVIISFLFSDYKDIALQGITERFESIWVLVSYIAIMAVTFKYATTKFRLKFIVGAIYFGAAVIGIIGVFQYFGMDIFNTDFAAKYVLGDMYQEGQTLNINFKDSVYSLLYNPNCVGMFCALTLPFSLFMAIFMPFSRDKIDYIVIKIVSVIMTIILAINLVGSDSRGGLVATAVAFALGFVIAVIYIFKNKKYREWSETLLYSIIGLVIVAIVSSAVYIVTNDEFSSRLAQNVQLIKQKISENVQVLTGEKEDFLPNYFQDVELNDEKNKVTIKTYINDVFETLYIEYDSTNQEIQLSDDVGVLIPFDKCGFSKERIEKKESLGQSKIAVKTVQGADLIFTVYTRGDKPFCSLEKDGIPIRFVLKNDTLNVVNKWNDIVDLNEKADSIGFEGSETFASGRGYIWSRSIPMIMSNGIQGIVAGYGPDSFAVAFPQDEVRAKVQNFGNPYIIVDKPHNFYLQTAINTGLISLIVLVVLFVIYVFRTIKSILRDIVKDKFIVALKFGFLTGIVGYLFAGLTTDSVVSVAPFFWVMLGAGFAVTELIKTEDNEKIIDFDGSSDGE